MDCHGAVSARGGKQQPRCWMLSLLFVLYVKTCLLENCRTNNVVTMSDYFGEGGNILYEIEGFT